jgi:hypothetical protein
MGVLAICDVKFLLAALYLTCKERKEDLICCSEERFEERTLVACLAQLVIGKCTAVETDREIRLGRRAFKGNRLPPTRTIALF